jgi:uncharacterized protein YndB with AHSA1/START domain
MNHNYIAHVSIEIKAGPAEVWDALTNPRIIKQYLFGTEAVSDWQVGSPIVYRGLWEGKSYEDKGSIVAMIPGKTLVTTYWSSLSGLPDTQENNNTITYLLAPSDGGTRLEVSQDNNKSEESKKHSEQNWKLVLVKMKEILESQK